MARRRALGNSAASAQRRTVPPAHRHALLFAAQFFAFGVILPFLPAVLAARGLSANEVALVLATGAAARLVAGPVGGALADALGAPRALLALSAAIAALAASGFALAAGLLGALLVYLLLSVAMAPIVPLTDAMTLAAARRDRFDYGPVRAWGSISFILAALLAGQAVAWAGAGAAVPLIATGFALTALAAAWLPPAPRDAVVSRLTLRAFAAPLRIVAFRRLVLVSALVQASHGFYYAFGTLHWQAAGLGAGTIGALWAAGVIAEILLFFRGGGLAARIGPVGLCLIAGGCGALRWAILALTDDPWVLFPVQALHAASFGAQHLATMALLARIVPPAGAGTAQAVHAALGPGLAMGVLTLACGPLYAAFGGGGYWAMAALCVLAIPATFRLRAALA